MHPGSVEGRRASPSQHLIVHTTKNSSHFQWCPQIASIDRITSLSLQMCGGGLSKARLRTFLLPQVCCLLLSLLFPLRLLRWYTRHTAIRLLDSAISTTTTRDFPQCLPRRLERRVRSAAAGGGWTFLAQLRSGSGNRSRKSRCFAVGVWPLLLLGNVAVALPGRRRIGRQSRVGDDAAVSLPE